MSEYSKEHWAELVAVYKNNGKTRVSAHEIGIIWADREIQSLRDQLEARREELEEAQILLKDLAKLNVGDGTDMYTCTLTADQWLHRADRLCGAISKVYPPKTAVNQKRR